MSLLSRRGALAALGSAAGLAMLARPWLGTSHAASGTAPKRLLVIQNPNSNLRANWVASGGRNIDTGEGDAKQFSLKPGNAALAAVRQHMTLLSGFQVHWPGGDMHTSAQINFMSGSNVIAEGNLSTRPSIDQLLASQSPLLSGTPYGSLQAIGDLRSDRSDFHHRILSYDLNAQAMPPQHQPQAVYERLFAGLAPGSTPETQRANLEKARAREQSVLDFVKGDLNKLYGVIPAADKVKLDRHLEGIREVERALDSLVNSAGQTVTLPTGLDMLAPNVSENHPQVVAAHLALIKAAFQLDLTRTVTFAFATANSYVDMTKFAAGFQLSMGIHALAHYEQDNTLRDAELSLATNWYCGVVAGFVSELAQIQELDGSSMLDNTLIVYFADVAQFHEWDDVPLAVFGGKNFGIEGGRLLRSNGRYTHDLWTAIAPRAFGVELAMLGDNPAHNRGPVPELFG